MTFDYKDYLPLERAARILDCDVVQVKVYADLGIIKRMDHPDGFPGVSAQDVQEYATGLASAREANRRRQEGIMVDRPVKQALVMRERPPERVVTGTMPAGGVVRMPRNVTGGVIRGMKHVVEGPPTHPVPLAIRRQQEERANRKAAAAAEAQQSKMQRKAKRSK